MNNMNSDIKIDACKTVTCEKTSHKNRIMLDDLDYTPHPHHPYPNPLIVKTLDDLCNNKTFLDTFKHFDNIISGSKAFKDLGFQLSEGYVTRFSVRDWETNQDLQFEMFKRIQNTEQFIFVQFVCNTGSEIDSFKKSLYTLYCFKLCLKEQYDDYYIEQALAKVDSGKWSAWTISTFEKVYGVDDYLLTNPQQESCVLTIKNGVDEKRVAIAYSVEENDHEILPAVLIEL
jgi:hypothetical protein